MPKELVISAAPHETRVAILEDGLLCEIYIEREKEFALVGSIYKGRVTRVLPGMQSAFVDIGLDSDAFLYVGDFLENLEDYDHVVAPAEGKDRKDGAAGRRRLRASALRQQLRSLRPRSLRTSEASPGNEAQPVRAHFRSAAFPLSRLVNFTPQPRPFQRRPRSRPRRGLGGGYGQGKIVAAGRVAVAAVAVAGAGGAVAAAVAAAGPDATFRHPSTLHRGPSRRGPISLPDEPAPPADYTPVILPGESLAKYKDRVPGSPASPARPLTESSSAQPAQTAPRQDCPRRSTPRLKKRLARTTRTCRKLTPSRSKPPLQLSRSPSFPSKPPLNRKCRLARET